MAGEYCDDYDQFGGDDDWITLDYTTKRGIEREMALEDAELILERLEETYALKTRWEEKVTEATAEALEATAQVSINDKLLTKLKREFRLLYLKFHPDKIRGLPESEQEKLLGKVQILNARFEKLK